MSRTLELELSLDIERFTTDLRDAQLLGLLGLLESLGQNLHLIYQNLIFSLGLLLELRKLLILVLELAVVCVELIDLPIKIIKSLVNLPVVLLHLLALEDRINKQFYYLSIFFFLKLNSNEVYKKKSTEI